MLRRIHVTLSLQAEEAQRETAQRVHGFYQESCPVYRSLHPQIQITMSLEFR